MAIHDRPENGGNRAYEAALESAAESLADSLADALPRANPMLLVKLAVWVFLGA